MTQTARTREQIEAMVRRFRALQRDGVDFAAALRIVGHEHGEDFQTAHALLARYVGPAPDDRLVVAPCQ